MTYVLDTNAVSALMKGSAAVVEHASPSAAEPTEPWQPEMTDKLREFEQAFGAGPALPFRDDDDP